MDAGQRLADMRRDRKISGNLLAKRSGVAQSTVSDIEHGKISPSIDTLSRLCSAMDVSLGEFFNVTSERVSGSIGRFVKFADKLSPDQMIALENFLESMLAG